jgi:hypothetical protein
LSVTNIKLYMAVERVERDEHTREDATTMQSLIKYRSQLKNAINAYFAEERQDIKVYGSDTKARKERAA